ncbi:VOC family protein, partial [Staphylococcus epidermidis]
DEQHFQHWIQSLKHNQVNILKPPPTHIKHKKSIYFTHPHPHKIQLHTPTLKNTIQYYKCHNTHIQFYHHFSYFNSYLIFSKNLSFIF